MHVKREKERNFIVSPEIFKEDFTGVSACVRHNQ